MNKMNKSLLVAALIAVAASNAGCARMEEQQSRLNQLNAERAIELSAQYKITIIDNAGSVLREWTSREYVDISQGVATFIDECSNKQED